MTIKHDREGEVYPAGSSTVIVTSAEAIQSLVSAAVVVALKTALPEAVRRATLKPRMSRAEFRELTGLSERQVSYLLKQRALPYSQQGRTVWFKTEDVLAYIDEGRVSAHKAA